LTGSVDRKLFATLTESYHGDTIGSVSLGYSEHFHRYVRGLLFPAIKIDPPHVFRFHRRMSEELALKDALDSAARAIDAHRHELAALVIEPLMQGAAGMWAHSPEYLNGVAKMARDAGALVIADEVATGFGRTGAMFACDRAGLHPDLMCLGKGITGGYLPLAATLATEGIFEAFLGETSEYRAFYYGHTYTGNPLAAAVALASLKLFRDEGIIERVQPRIAQLATDLETRFSRLAHVADIRQRGLMVGIELMQDVEPRTAYDPALTTGHQVIRRVRERGVIIRPLGDVIILMPPLSITETELKTLLDVTHDSIREVTGA
jgi:adenosylmethionine-8-amino-7-oxononanoate aminotransferase